jgi:hypothetical protein
MGVGWRDQAVLGTTLGEDVSAAQYRGGASDILVDSGVTLDGDPREVLTAVSGRGVARLGACGADPQHPSGPPFWEISLDSH